MDKHLIFSFILLSLGLIMFLFCNKIVKLTGSYKGKEGEFTIAQRISHIKITGLFFLMISIYLLIDFWIK